MNYRRLGLAMLAACFMMITSTPSHAADVWPFKKKPTGAVAEKPDSLKKPEPTAYDKLLKDAVSDDGMFTVHKVGQDWYFEIPEELFGRDILIVNKISSVTTSLNNRGTNKGMVTEEKSIRFYRDADQSKIYVAVYEPRINANPDDAIYQSVLDNYREPYIEFFPIAAYRKDSSAVVIKVNKVFDGSEKSLNDVLGFLSIQGAPRKDLSKIDRIKSFPENIVVKSVFSANQQSDRRTIPVTIDVTSNLVLLPEVPMQYRMADTRIGYFNRSYINFADDQQKPDKGEFIIRWRLEPREEDREKYLAGELVEPVKPIVFHIDPSTPPVWVPYIIEGVKDWQAAFEVAGFKNAIYAKEVDPEVDTDFDIDDVRYSVITYAASEKANAMGPSVVDPRSGEIIESDIIWWHNVMSLLQSWVRIQTSAVNPDARANEFPVELMGNAIRSVSSHEVGHTLGLMHNFAASYSVPVDSLRSRTFTDNNGTSSSIMDYARFNYIAQPGDDVVQMTPRIGIYDKHAINWGYRWFGYADPKSEQPTLNRMLREHENDPRYFYGDERRSAVDPRSQSEDLGDDAVKASRYGLNNLKYMMPHITDWTYEEGQVKYEAGKLLMGIISQWSRYNYHVLTNVGGVHLNEVVYGRVLDRYVPVPAAHQRACMRYVIDEALKIPSWLFEDEIWKTSYAIDDSKGYYEEHSPYSLARSMHYTLITRILAEDRLLRMYEAELTQGKGNAYTPEAMLADITNALFGKGGSLGIYDRVAQKNYVDALIVTSNRTMAETTRKGVEYHDGHDHAAHGHECENCTFMSESPFVEIEELPRPEDIAVFSQRINNSTLRGGETTSLKRAELNRILNIARSRAASGDQTTNNHYRDLELRIKEALRMVN